jgi:hypothetical protein
MSRLLSFASSTVLVRGVRLRTGVTQRQRARRGWVGQQSAKTAFSRRRLSDTTHAVGIACFNWSARRIASATTVSVGFA